ncbi:hypothetical protein A8709_32425 [Paenibacillus pectinilyticus]|uniref:Uncharacterized protein n=1 Tax=Paenibacillus pectinilyticus TaxID=512399 RepID=A0A1C0ZWQ9_9BACL|nr:hypothetical protein [Paenibacillus pectinilyticus]OCT12529.1 hypothetical protein A8709_32425 [Paenibacillus pectinilyticus]
MTGYYQKITNKHNVLQKISKSILRKFIDAKECEASKEIMKSSWLQYMVTIKLQSRILDEISDENRRIMKRIEKTRKEINDPYYEQDDYIELSSYLLEYEDRIKNNANIVLELASLIDDTGMYFEEHELRSAFSIDFESWKMWADRNKTLMTMFISKVGNEPLSWHLTEAIIEKVMSDPEAIIKMREKTTELFPNITFIQINEDEEE